MESPDRAAGASRATGAGDIASTGKLTEGSSDGTIAVRVCYLAPRVQTVIDVRVAASASLRVALDASGVLTRHPEIDLTVQRVGVFGKIKSLDDTLRDADRVEIYRPLIVDPKVARARRVEKARKAGSIEGRKWAPREKR